MANIMQMMQKAQKFKQQMEVMQARVQQMDLDGNAGGGMVTCKVSGKFELKSIKIHPSLLNAEEVDVLEDLVIAAVNDARLKAEKTMADETEKLMRDMGLPPGMGLPF